MLVSIITVCLNAEKTISRTVESIINQTWNGTIEYIIIDGKSEDHTLDEIETVRKHNTNSNTQWHIVSEPDHGLYDAMNKGIRMCHGDIIGIVNADDWYEKDTVQHVVHAFKKECCDLVHGQCRVVKDGREFSISVTNHQFLPQKCIEHPTCFVKKEIYDKLGVFNTKYKIAADYDLLLRFYFGEVRFHQINCVLTNFTRGGCSNSSNAIQLEELEIRHQYGLISRRYKKIQKLKYHVNEFAKKAIGYKRPG